MQIPKNLHFSYNFNMQKQNITNKNYTRFNDAYQLSLPLSCDALIPENDSVRLLSHILEGLDYKKLYMAYSKKGRKPAVEPKIMFKIIAYSYMNNIYSTHKIETACNRDINFMWLLEGYKAPDHATIGRFRQKYLVNAAEDLFYQLVMALENIDEINFDNVFIDGTKIEANANRYSFVWRKSINKNEEKMFEKIIALVEEINKMELQNFIVGKESKLIDINKVLEFLNIKKTERGLEFVHGIGKRKSKLQKFIEQLTEFRDRQLKYDESNRNFNGRNSYSKTDIHATFMHMKDDHMRNAQLKPGYNAQIAVNSEYIVGVGIFSDRNDLGTLKPMLENMKECLGKKFKNIVADSGYESEENYVYLLSNEMTAFIKPQTYEKWKKKSFKKDISKRENMKYDDLNDQYTCHNDKILKNIGTTTKTSKTGYESIVTNYECEDCSDCIYKTKCTKAKGNRRMQVSKNFIAKREISYKNILSDEGALLRMNRSIQVEGAFGVLKSDYNFTRFFTRGKNNVKTEFIMLCFGYNINKLHAKVQSERCATHLHEMKKVA